jgi:hypothetical protein
MSIDLLQLVLLEPSPSALDLLYLLDPGDEADALIIESIARAHGYAMPTDAPKAYEPSCLDSAGTNPIALTSCDSFEEYTFRSAQLQEIGEGLDSYAWSS